MAPLMQETSITPSTLHPMNTRLLKLRVLEWQKLLTLWRNMNLNKLFLFFSGGLIATHAVNSILIGTPWIGIVIWSLPLTFFFLQAWFKPTARVYQIFSFIILIYFMTTCLIVFGLPDANVLSWLELIEVVCVFFIAVYAAREQLRNRNVK